MPVNSDVKPLNMLIRSTLLASLLLVLSPSVFPQGASDQYWRSITEEDLRRGFAFFEKREEKAQLITIVIERSELHGGQVRSVERWSFTGCGRVREYQVTFNPDSFTRSSYKLKPK